MVKVQRGDCELYVDGFLKTNLDFFGDRVALNWDFLGLSIGEEGDGKTTLIEQVCLYQDPNFSLQNCIFNVEQFNEAVEALPKGSAIIWDESDELDATNLRKVLLAVKRKFKRIRSKNMFIWLVTPTFFDLNKYFIMHRIQCMIRVYANELERGYFAFYSRHNMRKLYLKGKKEWNIYAHRHDFVGSFTKFPKGFPINQDEYEAKKDDATAQVMEEQQTNQQALKQYRQECVKRAYRLKEQKGSIKTQKDLAFMFKCSDRTIRVDIGEIAWDTKEEAETGTTIINNSRSGFDV